MTYKTPELLGKLDNKAIPSDVLEDIELIKEHSNDFKEENKNALDLDSFIAEELQAIINNQPDKTSQKSVSNESKAKRGLTWDEYTMAILRELNKPTTGTDIKKIARAEYPNLGKKITTNMDKSLIKLRKENRIEATGTPYKYSIITEPKLEESKTENPTESKVEKPATPNPEKRRKLSDNIRGVLRGAKAQRYESDIKKHLASAKEAGNTVKRPNVPERIRPTTIFRNKVILSYKELIKTQDHEKATKIYNLTSKFLIEIQKICGHSLNSKS